MFEEPKEQKKKKTVHECKMSLSYNLFDIVHTKGKATAKKNMSNLDVIPEQ